MKNYQGKILDAGYTLEGLHFVKLSSFPEIFDYSSVNLDMNILDGNQKLIETKIYANDIDEFMIESEKFNVKYISISKSGSEGTAFWYPYLLDLYDNEQKYEFLKKVFDSSDLGYEKFNVKVFEINYSNYP